MALVHNSQAERVMLLLCSMFNGSVSQFSSGKPIACRFPLVGVALEEYPIFLFHGGVHWLPAANILVNGGVVVMRSLPSAFSRLEETNFSLVSYDCFTSGCLFFGDERFIHTYSKEELVVDYD